MARETALRAVEHAWHELGDTLERYEMLVCKTLGAPDALALLSPGISQVLGRTVDPPRVARIEEASTCRGVAHRVMSQRVREVQSHAAVPRPRGVDMSAPTLRAWAGVPLLDVDGIVLGALVAGDHATHLWSERDLSLLDLLASSLASELAQRVRRLEDLVRAAAAASTASAAHERLRLSLDLATAATWEDLAAITDAYAAKQWRAQGVSLWVLDGGAADTEDEHVPGRVFGGADRRSWRNVTGSRTSAADGGHDHPVAHGASRVGAPEREWSPTTPDGALDPAASQGSREVLRLLRGDLQVGALVVHGADDGQWPPVDIDDLTAEIATAVRRIAEHRQGVTALETLKVMTRSVLPSVLGLRFVGRHLPAKASGGVGGDWYDVVVAPTGATSVIIGDLMGHDISTAAPTTQVRSVLRALAWAVEDSPSQQLSLLESTLDAVSVQALATVVLARIDAPDADGARLLTWANAGHPPPLLLSPGGAVRWLEIDEPDVMIGVVSGVTREDRTELVPPGSVVLFYTDGLVEQRGRDLETGLEYLRQTVADHHDLPLEDLVELLVVELPGPEPADDTAVLAVRIEARHHGAPPDG